MAPGSRLQELTAKYMQNPRRYFVPLANEYRKTNELDRAIALCREHLPAQPGHMSGHIVLGRAYFEKGDIAAAREVFLRSVELDDENLIALRHLGDIARSRDDVEEARSWYARVLDADPQNDEIEQLLRSLGDAAPSNPDLVTVADAPAPTELTGLAATVAAPFGDLTELPAPIAEPEHLPKPAAAAFGSLDSALTDPTPPGLRAISGAENQDRPLDALVRPGTGPELPPVPRVPFDRFDLSTLSDDVTPVPEMESTAGAAEIRVDDGVGFVFDDLDELVDPTAVTGAGLSLPPVDEADFSAGIATPTQPQVVPAEPVADELLSRPGFGALASFASWRTAQERDTPAHVPAQPEPAAVVAPPAVAPHAAADEGLFWETPSTDAASTAPEFITETMAALYAKQGFIQQALDVYRALLVRSPADRGLMAKVTEMQAALATAPAETSLQEDADKALQFGELDDDGSAASDAASMLETMYEVSPPSTQSDDAAFGTAWNASTDDDAGDDWFADASAPDLGTDSTFAGDEMFGVSVDVFGQPARPSASDDVVSAPAVSAYGASTATLESLFGAPTVAAADQTAADMLLTLATQMVGRLPKEAPTLPVPDILELPSAVAGDEVAGTSPAPLLSFDRFFSGSGSPPRARIDTPASRPGTPTWPTPAPSPAPSLSPTFGGLPVIPPTPSVTPATWAAFDQFLPQSRTPSPVPPSAAPVPRPVTPAEQLPSISEFLLDPPALVTKPDLEAVTDSLPVAAQRDQLLPAVPTPSSDLPSIAEFLLDVPPFAAAPSQATPQVSLPPVPTVAAPPSATGVPALTPPPVAPDSAAAEVAPESPAPAAAPETSASRPAPSEFHRWLEGLS